MLESNQQFINILLKARSGLEVDLDFDETEKLWCNEANYAILAYGNPNEYPLSTGSPFYSLKPGDFSSEDNSCTIGESSVSMSSSSMSSGPFIISMCDCSDPENYNFYDQGRFKI